METSITSETISQLNICGDLNNIEIANDTEPKLIPSREQMEIGQMRINLKNAREVYFKYSSSHRMAHTKATVRKRVAEGAKTVPHSQSLKAETGKVPQHVKRINKDETTQRKRYRPGTRALKKIRKFQKLTKLIIPKVAFLRLVWEIIEREYSWYWIQAGAVLALHEAVEVYIVRLFDETNLCAIHVKWVTSY